MERKMSLSRIAIRSAMVLSLVALPHSGWAQDLRGEIEAIVKDYLATHPDEVAGVVKNYMIQHPEMLGQMLAGILKRRAGALGSASAAPSAGTVDNPASTPQGPGGDDDHSVAVASNAALLFSSPHQVTLGNLKGDVTLVEFFDYSCGFCKRALPDLMALLKDDPKLRVVLKEFPILGPGSAEAARVAIAVRMQDSGGQKYLAFHEKLLGGPGPISEERALAVAQEQGIDMKRLKKDMASDEVNVTLGEDMKLASALGINGTPSYIIGNTVVVGAVGLVGLEQRIAMTRDTASR
jgi:protein-disulfide isomerase